MEPLKKIVKNQYFPAAAVLVAVVLFWVTAAFGGLSLLNDNEPPLATLTWMLFVYAAAVLTPLAGVLAGMDVVRRWLRDRNAAPAYDAEWPLEEQPPAVPVQEQPATNHQPKSQPSTKPSQARQHKKAA